MKDVQISNIMCCHCEKFIKKNNIRYKVWEIIKEIKE